MSADFFSVGRIYAMVLRYLRVLVGSWPRIFELAYWPVVQMVVWGFMTVFLAGKTSYIAGAFGVLLSAIFLWDAFFRFELGVCVSFLEDMWSRNLGNLFVSPLRPYEMAIALMVMSLIRTLIGFIPTSLLAIWFFGFSIYSLGLSFAVFFINLLIFGQAIGLAVSGLIMKYGLGAESIAWGIIFLLLPVSAVYYPISVLPEWLQYVGWALPTAHTFEGMRALLVDREIRLDLMASAAALNVIYLGFGMLAFLGWFEAARREGRILQQGE